jgi:hypothetical protein
LKNKILIVTLLSILFGILLIASLLFYNDTISESKPTQSINKETAIAALTIGEIKPMLEMPKKVITPLRLEILPTYTPQPTYTIELTEKTEIQKSLSYQIATVQPNIPQTNLHEGGQIGAQAVALPATVQEFWLAGKTILIDVGLWYPLQNAMSLILIIMLVFIILSWLKP